MLESRRARRLVLRYNGNKNKKPTYRELWHVGFGNPWISSSYIQKHLLPELEGVQQQQHMTCEQQTFWQRCDISLMRLRKG
jgi:hypothetical protein